jgi:5-epi-alpha-selinene synthase
MLRPFTGAVYTDFALIEIAGGFELPIEMHQHILLQSLSLIGCNVVCFANDLFSFTKEVRDGEAMNLVSILQHEYDLTLQEAIDRAAAIHDAEVRAFENIEAQIQACGLTVNANLWQYIDGLRAWMRGNLDWSMTSGRYNHGIQSQTVGG